MALLITEECTACDACEPVCPNEAITAGNPIYVIDPEKCTECVGAEDEPQCKLVCPAECIVQNPNYIETKRTAEQVPKIARVMTYVPPLSWSRKGRLNRAPIIVGATRSPLMRRFKAPDHPAPSLSLHLYVTSRFARIREDPWRG